MPCRFQNRSRVSSLSISCEPSIVSASSSVWARVVVGDDDSGIGHAPGDVREGSAPRDRRTSREKKTRCPGCARRHARQAETDSAFGLQPIPERCRVRPQRHSRMPDRADEPRGIRPTMSGRFSRDEDHLDCGYVLVGPCRLGRGRILPRPRRSRSQFTKQSSIAVSSRRTGTCMSSIGPV